MESKNPQRRPLYYNIVSHVGFLVALGSAALMFFALVTSLTVERINPYVGILTYLVFPAILMLGVALILVGMRWEAVRRKRAHSLEDLPYPRIDLNEARQRRLFGYALMGSGLAVVVTAWASYQGFLYTESVQFCGTTCHVPMEPEHTAYLASAHARVPCVECHVGEGAGWYVRSKLSGARQLLAVTFGTYSRPIATPIEHLRPARETCERCHWPQKFFGSKLLQLPHFRYDEKNSAEQISFILKTGGGSRAQGADAAGIHWHMVIDNKVTFVAEDKKLQKIPWVKVKHSDGTETVYKSRDTQLSNVEIDRLPHHVMDCMDCHNRPAHGFPTPDSEVDQALLKGMISRDLPWVKKVTVEALQAKYEDRDSAHAAIRGRMREFYQKQYPKVFDARQADIQHAVDVATSIYDRGVFPKMNVDWRTYPVNIGHRSWPGCFRCHDGQHVSDDGRVLPRDCSKTCHTLPERGLVTTLGTVDPFAGPDWHPWEMPTEHVQVKAHEKVLCHQCHLAGQRPKKDCNDCHSK